MKKITLLLVAMILNLAIVFSQLIPVQTTGGTSGRIPVFSGTSTINNSQIYEYSGKIGIGVATPSQTLESSGNISAKGSHFVFNSNSGVIDWGGGGTGVLYFRRLNTQGDVNTFTHIASFNANGYFGILTPLQGSALQVNGNAAIGYYNSTAAPANGLSVNGNVGIGTSSPTQKLQIDHSDASGGITLNQLNSTSSKSEIRFNHSGTELWGIGNDFSEDNHQTFFIWDHVAQSARFLINQNGNVGIGTTTPGAKLEINSGTTNGLVVTTQQTTQYGYCIQALVSNNDTKAFSSKVNGTENFIVYGNESIWARDIHVKAGTPFGDFIFDKNYDLFSISELENFISKHHHLPGIPSAAEVEEKGINVGDFQNLLLQKIEEQALYIINLQKQIDEMKALMNASRKN